MRGGLRVVGYHGTSGGVARKILRGGFRPSQNDYDWLGFGTYFFEENEEHAREWARERFADDPAVIGAAIDLAGVLDLTEHGALKALKRTAGLMQHVFRRTGTSLPKNRSDGRRFFDRMLIDVHCETSRADGVEFPVVRGLFEEGSVIHSASHIRDLTHIQLAVRDNRAILGTWRVKP